MIAWGLFAVCLYTFLLGSVVPPQRQVSLAELLLQMVAASLFLSWMVAALSFWLKLPDLSIPLTIILALSLAWQWRAPVGFVVLDQSIVANSLKLSAALLVTYFVFDWVAGGWWYDVIFEHVDAVASWNRWAVELSSNEFNPYPAAYPTLFPAIWSLVYKAQGTADIWWIAKASLFVLPALLVMLFTLLIERRFLIATAGLIYLALDFFFVRLRYALFDGNMDGPVAVIVLVAAMTTAVAALDVDRDEGDPWQMLLIAALFAGIAAITKQAGLLTVVPVAFVALYALAKRQIGARRLLGIAAILVLPIGSFLAMFFSRQTEVVGNMEVLSALADRGGLRENLSAAYLLVKEMGPEHFLGTLIALSGLNLLNIRRLPGQLGMLIFVLAVAGFIAFAKCCSYEPRNGWWIVSLLVTSSFLGLWPVERLISRRASSAQGPWRSVPLMAGGIAMTALLLTLASFPFLTRDRAYGVQEVHQWNLGGANASALVRRNFEGQREDSVLLSVNAPIGWLPGMRDRYRHCHYNDPVCGPTVISQAVGDVYIVMDLDDQETIYTWLNEAPSLDTALDVEGSTVLMGPY